ncbi:MULTISPECIES: alpha/beta hydrolase [Kitasatospora]|uniref:Putative peptidase S33 family protein n=1 Tax=Kitasatospora setae (strain ATCC 33774 / DSM 43861 / JCM 3304 / KCC A-0304 / NBRC 14216 / KM-6054) TaxID=452652 RepID=E4NGM0_KITSK|nr:MULTISPECIES: alpha/beta hydrolase [Kitasatospora]BAJ30650.1 putative peptidase S33 family protein [Kitasatospora setae KM-6054]
MSTPPFLELPSCARAGRVAGLAALWGEPAGAVRGTALLVPGFTGSKEDFIALLEPLAGAGFRTVAVDLRGQYESAGPDDPAAYTVPALAADVRAVTAALGADGPVHLLGHSFGGHVVREAVLAEPGALPWRTLTLMSTGPALAPAEAGRMALLRDALGSMDLESVWQAIRQLEGERVPPVEPEIEEFLHRRWLANHPLALAAAAAHLVAPPDRVAELAAAVGGLPTLVLSGERDYAWPVEEQSAMAERLRAVRRTVSGAGHSPNTERPAQTAEFLAGFWSG